MSQGNESAEPRVVEEMMAEVEFHYIDEFVMLE
jgi:hypothetical protein